MKTEHEGQLHEIRLKGRLGKNTLVLFDAFSADYSDDGETILRGPIIDQAELHGLLTQICSLGLTLTFFRQLKKETSEHED